MRLILVPALSEHNARVACVLIHSDLGIDTATARAGYKRRYRVFESTVDLHISLLTRSSVPSGIQKSQTETH